jgi:hypothetical protein
MLLITLWFSLILCVSSGIVKASVHIKVRTYSKSADELWFDEWSNPLEKRIPVASHAEIMQRLIDNSE